MSSTIFRSKWAIGWIGSPDPLGSWVVHFKGVTQIGLLKNAEAIQSLTTFLIENPNAPERLRVSAWRQIHQLKAIKEGEISDVGQRMSYSKRRLRQAKTGDLTQKQQQKIIELLDKLIKNVEKKECSSCNTKKMSRAQKKSSKQKEQKVESQIESTPKAKSKAIVKKYSDAPASPWSRLRERSRDPANNAIKEKLPPKYRDLIERYQKAANGDK